MKKSNIILVIIIFLLIGYIIIDKLNENNLLKETNTKEVKIIDKIELDYVNIILCSDGVGYLEVLDIDKINNLNVGSNFKDRLTTLYNKAFFYDIYLNNNKLKGYKIELSSNINKIRKIVKDDNIYIVFIKDDNKIGLFNYIEYYDLLYTNIIDNYNNYQNVLDIKDNKIIYLDGSSEDFVF